MTGSLTSVSMEMAGRVVLPLECASSHPRDRAHGHQLVVAEQVERQGRADQLGMPVHPEWYSDEFGRPLERAALPRITLHDSRHTTLTALARVHKIA
jgi:hypothetical protein